MEMLQYIGSIGGIGGIFGIVMFLVYRQTVKQVREDRKFMENRLTGLVEENFQIRERSISATVKHAQVLTELIVWLKAKNGSK